MVAIETEVCMVSIGQCTSYWNAVLCSVNKLCSFHLQFTLHRAICILNNNAESVCMCMC